jgi:C_GCAxxG_C_C family probable redox protein
MNMEPDMTTPAEIAVGLFGSKFNCAQSVFAAFAPQIGLEQSQALKLASPFGGGVARRGQVCGAVTGALMVLGLIQGADTPAGKEEAYRLGEEFLQNFESRHKSILCRDLLGCDIHTPKGRQKAQGKDLFNSLCPLFVRSAAEIAQAMLVEKPLG